MKFAKHLNFKESDAAYFLCITALYVFFISDACNKILYAFNYDFFRISIFFRSIYEVLFLSAILFFINDVRFLFLKLLLFLFVLFIGGQILISLNASYDYNYLENISHFNKYFFVFIIYFSVYRIQDHTDKFQKVLRLMENIFMINSTAVIIGFIFNLNFLKTYALHYYLHGFSGFIPAQNEATMFVFIMVSYFYYKHFILNLKSWRFYFILFSSLLLGTKGIYLFLAILLIFHFLYFSNLKTKIISLTLIVIISIGLFFYFQTEQAKVFLEYYLTSLNRQGWYGMLVSGRNSYVTDRIPGIIRNWNIVNYFIGGEDQTRQLIEMDFFDLFFFMGIIGTILFFVLYFTSVFKFNMLRPFNLFFVFSFFALAFFGGHFFASAVNSLYVCLFSIYIYASQRNNQEYL